MSNRLEEEFPEVGWQAMPPLAPGGVPLEVMRQCLERGRRLRSRALRHSLRTGGAAVLRGLARAVTFLRCASLALVRRRPARDCWTGAAHGA